MISMTSLRSLFPAIVLCAGASWGMAQNSVSVAWQNSNAANTRLKDLNGAAELTAGAAAVGDGAVLQLGYYTNGTSAAPFAGSFVALTGKSSANTELASTSVGDAPGGTSGRFSLISTFVQDSGSSGQNLPAAGIPMVIRFYNRATIVASTHFNEVSSGTASWQWKAPSLAPGGLILISLSDAGLIWRGVPFQTSEPVGGAGGGNFVLDSNSAQAGQSGSQVQVSFTTTNQADAWSVSTSAAWITFTSATSGAGDGSITLSIASNPGAARQGTVTIAGNVFTVNQSGTSGGTGGGAVTLNPVIAGFKGGGGTGSFRVITPATDLSWTAVSNAPWLTITGSDAGTGSGTVNYAVSAFSGPGERTGTITINGVIFTVVQAVTLPTSTLTVATFGPGSVSGQLPVTRTVGAKYTLTAKPAPGAIFNGWTGENITFAPGEEFDPVLNFVMQQNTSLTANFKVNPFAVSPTVTTYTGLVEGEDPYDPAQAGLLKLTASKTGKISGKLTLGAKAYTLKGAFTGDGQAGVVLKRTGATSLYAELVLSSAGPTLTAEIFDESADGPPIGSVTAPSSVVAKPYANAGSFTIVLPDAIGGNFGSGYATLKISTKGGATVKGKLPDGTALVISAVVDVMDGIALYKPLYYKKTGFIAGTAHFRDVPETSDLDGDLIWLRPPARVSDRSPYYRDGFESAVTLLGSRYAKPVSGVRAIALANSTNNAVFAASDGDLNPSPLLVPVTWDSRNKLFGPLDLTKLKLSLNVSTGLLSGSFTHNAIGKKKTFGGVVFQKQNRADGLFLGVQEAGTITITAP